MLKRSLILLPLLAASAVWAQQAPASTPSKPLLLWKATSGKKTAYLFGSLHLGDKSFYPLPATVENAFAASDVLIVEVDLKKVNMMALAATMMQEGMYQGDDNLWSHISADTKHALEAYCKRLNMPVDMFARMKPWMVSMTLAALTYQKAGMDASLGLDQHFMDEAGDKRVDQLETAEWQMKLFTSLSADIQEKLLASSLDSGDPMAESKELVAAWVSGDATRVDNLIRKHSEGPPEFTRQLLEDRNPHMADAISHCLETSDRCFMVVGAAHLVGKEGVVALLTKRGIDVRQMNSGMQ